MDMVFKKSKPTENEPCLGKYIGHTDYSLYKFKKLDTQFIKFRQKYGFQAQ